MPKQRKPQKKTKKIRKPVKTNVLANNQDPRPIRAMPSKGRSNASIKPHHVRGVCSVTDPFCPASKNSKWPDGTSGNTLTEQFRGSSTITIDAAGKAYYCFSASAPFGYNGATIVGTNPPVGTFAAAYTTYKASSMLATYGSTYRIVSFGAIIRTTASATNASGIVTLGTAPAAGVSGAYNMGEELYSEVTIKAIQPGMEVSWISTPVGTGSRDFVDQSTTAIVVNDWNALWVEVQGATASTSCLNIEWFLNVEFRPISTARALTAIARPNPPKSVAAETAVSSVHSTVGSFIAGGIATVEDTIAKHARDALSGFFDDPLSSLSMLFA